MTDTDTHQGYTNYATFSVAVVLDNTRRLNQETWQAAKHLRETAADHENVPDIWTEEEAARFTLADWLKEYVRTQVEYRDPSSMAASMAEAGMAEVDWDDLARTYLTELAIQS